MPDYSQVTLGEVQLVGFEVPQSLPFGGDQQLIVTRFIGTNKRHVQALGSQPRPIAWGGVFLYDSALDRARYIDNLRVRGEVQRLTWGDFSFDVRIQSFNFDPANVFNIPYTITCEVVRDLTAPETVLRPSLDTIEQGIIGVIATIEDAVTAARRVIALVDAARRGSFSGIVGGAATLVASVGALGGHVGLAPAPVISALALQAEIISHQAVGVYNGLTGRREHGLLQELNALSAGVEETISIGNNTAVLAQLLQRFVVSPSVLTVTVIKGNLFAIASQYYGDATKWSAIADFNGLADAQITKPTTLKLPPINGVSPTKVESAVTVTENQLVFVPAAERGPRKVNGRAA